MLEGCESIRSDELWTFPRPEHLGVPRKLNRSLSEPADSRVLYEQRGSLGREGWELKKLQLSCHELQARKLQRTEKTGSSGLKLYEPAPHACPSLHTCNPLQQPFNFKGMLLTRPSTWDSSARTSSSAERFAQELDLGRAKVVIGV